MPLESQTVEAIFARMAVRYGSAWFAKWDGAPMDLVKVDWAKEIEGFSRDAILFALGNLPPDFPPNAAQFRALCIRTPEKEPPPLILDRAGIERRDAELRRLAAIKAETQRHDPKGWARRLKDREGSHGGTLENGRHMTGAQRTMWRAALAAPEFSTAGGSFTPVARAALPPAIRAEVEA